MKNFALNGICCGPSGHLTVTDADRIELSNLTRQFLFREHNVGQPKSKAAAAMATVMNPSFQVESLELFVGPKTESHFNDAFWTGLDGVCNALDNMEARFYVDNQCVKYEKSLLESGTMGPSGNVDTVVPFKTRTYQEGGQAADTGDVPMCTLRNFPQITDHCIEWARDQFELFFAKLGKDLELAITDPAAFEKKTTSGTTSENAANMRCVVSFAKAARDRTVASAAQLAFDMFHFSFRDKILDLQAQYPRDARMIDSKTKEDKGPFWSEKKRFPTAAQFNPADTSHADFLRSATALFAVAIGAIPAHQENDDGWLADWRTPQFIEALSQSLTPPPFLPCPMHVEGESEEQTAAIKATGQARLDELLAELRGVLGSMAGAVPKFGTADFEKDDDFNFHIAFINAAANLRCDNYGIKRTDFNNTKIIAGKIIAAIATTTAAVCGLVMLELIKVQQGKPTESYMNRQVGLGANTFTSFTQDPPHKHSTSKSTVGPDEATLAALGANAFDASGKIKAEFYTEEVKKVYPEGYSLWDKLQCDGDMTLTEFAQWLEDEHKLSLDQWDFVYGRKQDYDENGKKIKALSSVTTRVFPALAPLDYSLVPALDLTPAQATKAIMSNPRARPQQRYEGLWAECVAAGKIESPPADPMAITPDSTLRHVLHCMQAKGEHGEQTKTLVHKTVSCIDNRMFWVIPSAEAPICCDEDGEQIDSIASIKIILKK